MDVTLAITISYSETVFRASREMQMHVYKNGINVFIVTADSQCRQRFLMDTTSFNNFLILALQENPLRPKSR